MGNEVGKFALVIVFLIILLAIAVLRCNTTPEVNESYHRTKPLEEMTFEEYELFIEEEARNFPFRSGMYKDLRVTFWITPDERDKPSEYFDERVKKLYYEVKGID